MIPMFCQPGIIGFCVDFERLTAKRMCYEYDASALLVRFSRTPPKGVEKLTQFNLRIFNACSRFLACALMLLWFAGPLKKWETIES
jgi:hypothetical protein